MGLEASHLHGFVKDFPDVITYWQDGRRPGIILTNELKNLYRTSMIGTLYNRKILFERDMFTTTRGMDTDSILHQLREEFERFCFKKIPANGETGKDRYTLSGKIGGNQDDCLIALLMVNKFAQDLAANPRHEVFSSLNPNLVRTEARVIECK